MSNVFGCFAICSMQIINVGIVHGSLRSQSAVGVDTARSEGGGAG